MPLFEEVRWRGPAEAELKVDERDGRAKILEINPRFSGAIHFPISCGVNLPALLCRAALGERLPRVQGAQYAAGARYVDTMRWAAAVLAELRGGRSSRRDVVGRAAAEFLGQRVPSYTPCRTLCHRSPSCAWVSCRTLRTTAASARLCLNGSAVLGPRLSVRVERRIFVNTAVLGIGEAVASSRISGSWCSSRGASESSSRLVFLRHGARDCARSLREPRWLHVRAAGDRA